MSTDTNLVQKDSTETEDELLGSIGFMFDAQRARSSKSVTFSNGLEINIRLIGGDPGSVRDQL